MLTGKTHQAQVTALVQEFITAPLAPNSVIPCDPQGNVDIKLGDTTVKCQHTNWVEQVGGFRYKCLACGVESNKDELFGGKLADHTAQIRQARKLLGDEAYIAYAPETVQGVEPKPFNMSEAHMFAPIERAVRDLGKGVLADKVLTLQFNMDDGMQPDMVVINGVEYRHWSAAQK